MENDMMLRGLIKGMEMQGAELVKLDSEAIYFEIETDGELDDMKKLKLASYTFKEQVGRKLKIRLKK